MVADTASLTEGIQLALAPVFLLTAVANLVSALTQRLSRVVDRSRFLQDKLLVPDASALPQKSGFETELGQLATRGWLINASMVFVVICGVMIGLTVLELFLAETSGDRLQLSRIVVSTFVSGIGSFLIALVLLLVEVLVASYSIRWKHQPTR
ncbi:MAG: DUF2721 domain-containing protein [Betaproteobacteria bacterium]|nr:DUF2721 domain-containing protein [Betaproteobacteria bacterium]MDE2623138.1 DUF2721 domain-containing protein [Betaproteobacteria bacterium]